MQKMHRKNKGQEVLVVVKAIPYRNFKEKISIIKQETGCDSTVEVHDGFIYVESRYRGE